MIHKTSIDVTHELIKTMGQPYPSNQRVHQAMCTCGWKGPRRMRLWESDNDAENHKKYPDVTP